MKWLLPIICAGLLLGSCNKDPQLNRVKAIVNGFVFSDTLTVGQTHTVTVQYNGTNGCSAQDGVELIELSRNTIVTPYYTQPASSQPCTEILPGFEETFTITPTLTGWYYLTAHDGGIKDSIWVNP